MTRTVSALPMLFMAYRAMGASSCSFFITEAFIPVTKYVVHVESAENVLPYKDTRSLLLEDLARTDGFLALFGIRW